MSDSFNEIKPVFPKEKNLRYIILKFLKSFRNGVLLKIAFSMLANRLNMRKVISNSKSFFKFGLMCGTFSLVFQLTRLVIKKFDI